MTQLRAQSLAAFLLPAAGLLLATLATARADDYPTRPIKLLVGASAGGTTDTMGHKKSGGFMRQSSRVTAAAILGVLMLSPVNAAELKVLAGGSMTASLKELGPRFEKATGHKLDITFAATPELIKMATSGPFDLGVVPIDVMKNDAAKAKFAGAPANIARVGYGVAVKAGAPKPDVSTPGALKATLLKAQSIAVFPGSAAGAFVQKTFERLGVAEQIKDRLKVQAAPGAIPQAVAKGDAELGVFLTNVLNAPGVELAGPFPGDLQQELVFVGAVAADSKDAAAAKAFLDYLKTPEAVGVFKAKGVTAG